MRLRSLVLLLALAFCLVNAKPLTEAQSEENTEAEKKDTTPETNEAATTTTAEATAPTAEDEKKEEVEQTPAEEQPEESKETSSENETSKEVEEDETEDSSEGAKKDEVPNKTDTEEASENEDVADVEDDKDEDNKKEDSEASKRYYGGGEEGGHHGGDEGGHEGHHGHHEHDHHGHDHHHHDHGYEFYEEWGEHGGHEGEHHGHHEGGHHGEHGHHHGHHGHGGYKKSNTEKVTKEEDKTAPETSKKWWLVGDHWGGWGHSHWGHPSPCRDAGGWQWGHTGLHGHGCGGGYGGYGWGGGHGGYGYGGHGGYGWGGGHGGYGYGGYGGHGGYGLGGYGGYGGHYGGYGGHYKSEIPECCKSKDPKVTKRCGCHLGTTHGGGYHFTDHGSGHDNHDHTIQGPWTFGYDHFGDDWSDWDHNLHNFEYLRHMEHLPHDDHHCGHGRACVPLSGLHQFSSFYPSLHFEAPYGFGGGYGFGGLGYGGFGGGYGLGGGLNDFGVYGHNGWPVHRYDNYRVCHKCHDLPSGGSRCLCKSVRHHPLYLPVVHRPAHVYIDCDTSAHKFPHNRCYARADIPTPEEESTESGSAKQGVFYPYANYGPWSAYPWWGDWWGGHGHHAWGEGHGHGGCGRVGGCGGHRGGCGGGGCGHHGMGRAVGFSFGHTRSIPQAYHCKDEIDKGEDGEGTTKRFCVPIGYRGGYGFPYFHGYPGVGTGLWGWGWPWIKNKVPGSKDKSKDKKVTKEASKDTKKSSIPKSEGRQTKKQTIHVGYGYASGDNYRLGYGMGGMGGVAGFTGPHDPINAPIARSRIPAPESTKDVTGTKRNMAFAGPASGSMLGHPVTHPGFTTMGYPGHADSSVEAQKSTIPKKI